MRRAIAVVSMMSAGFLATWGCSGAEGPADAVDRAEMAAEPAEVEANAGKSFDYPKADWGEACTALGEACERSIKEKIAEGYLIGIFPIHFVIKEILGLMLGAWSAVSTVETCSDYMNSCHPDCFKEKWDKAIQDALPTEVCGGNIVNSCGNIITVG